MGFSGGGANVTKAHTHDGAVVQDGGSLAANATQFGLTNGSLLYSDGTNIQELGVGASGYVLGTAAGTIPTWEASAASIVMNVNGQMVYYDGSRTALDIGSESDILTVSAGGLPVWTAPTPSSAALTFVEEFELGGDNANWTITPTTPLDLSAYQEFNIQIMFNHITAIGDLNVRINGDDQASYFMEGIKVFETTVTGLQEQNATEATLVPNTPANHTIRLEISWIGNQFNTGRQVARYWCMAGDETVISGIFALSDAVTEITSLDIRMAGGSIEADARARLYRLAAS